MRNINKKQNLVEQARINLDKEKISHSITRVKVEKLETFIKEVREIVEKNKVSISIKPYSKYAIPIEDIKELLDKVGSDKE